MQLGLDRSVSSIAPITQLIKPISDQSPSLLVFLLLSRYTDAFGRDCAQWRGGCTTRAMIAIHTSIHIRCLFSVFFFNLGFDDDEQAKYAVIHRYRLRLRSYDVMLFQPFCMRSGWVHACGGGGGGCGGGGCDGDPFTKMILLLHCSSI